MASRSLAVVQLVPELESGGVERGTLEVAAELVRRGHRSIVISGGGRMVPELKAGGSEHVTWEIGKKSFGTLRYVRRLRRFLSENHIDLVHARSRVPAWVAWLAWRGMNQANRPRFVTTCHGLYSATFYSSVMVRGEVVIAISGTVEQHIRAKFPAQAKRTRIRRVYRGVDPAEFPLGYQPPAEWLSRWYDEFPETRDKSMITLPGRLTRLKGQMTFVDLMTRLRDERPDVMGLIVGGADPRRRKYAQSLRDRVAERNLRNVVFTGHRSDLREILATSSLACSLTSQPPEAFGRTSLEALSLGTPVVGFEGSGVGEILAELFPEGIVSTGNMAELTERVVEILDNPPTLRPNRRFTLQNMLDDTMDVYRELAGGDKAARVPAA
jgi:glycosyltransferase involved in cell wall biosynthesis